MSEPNRSTIFVFADGEQTQPVEVTIDVEADTPARTVFRALINYEGDGLIRMNIQTADGYTVEQQVECTL